ncbi:MULTISPECIES: hypothetical protein [unclassified Chryseobacterium]|uniref:hypothetical protein n=1 Tax=unclassified Chryseobacterium TaxID=2593645 RepID=UPI000D3AF23B|nr:MULTISPECIES: hypothetical protein [unclassified Chryseobacterium]PTT72595.1 hypothetical protein DBR25_14330 [Chryseobacterium sp. HMWF001]PVV50416.1 hypothetical protein DD829_22390 [Chryseobacterium sp. HMWF035]
MRPKFIFYLNLLLKLIFPVKPSSYSYLLSLIHGKIIASSIGTFTIALPNKDRFGNLLEQQVYNDSYRVLIYFLKINFGGASIYDVTGLYQNIEESSKIFKVEILDQQNLHSKIFQLFEVLKQIQILCNQETLGVYFNDQFHLISFE